MPTIVYLIFYRRTDNLEDTHVYCIAVKEPNEDLLIPSCRVVGRVTTEVELEE